MTGRRPADAFEQAPSANGAGLLVGVEGLTIAFPGSAVPVVDGLSLQVRRGECIALVGESGSGKSLTARAILGLLPDDAFASFDRLEVPSPRTTATLPAPPRHSRDWAAIRGAHAALVPQDALGGLDPLRRIEHEVGDALRLHDLAQRKDRRPRVVSALRAAGMPEPETRLRQRSDELSGGLRQRALVASALIADPRFIVADEPTTALDTTHRTRVLQELRRRADAGAGILLITHDLTSVLDIADFVHVMRDGRIVESGAPERVLRAPQHPFTRELIASSPAGKPRGTRLLSSVNIAPQRSRGVDAAAPAPLNLEQVSVNFSRAGVTHRVLDHASLEVRSGETVGLVGESGSGKTTLLRVALGLLSPGAGRVRVAGVDWAEASAKERRRLRKTVAFVPQDPLDSFPVGASGAQILRDALRAGGTPSRERTQRAGVLADEVGLPLESLFRPARELSGGQRQRLAVARALARDPQVLLLDEPVSALDVTVQARVLDLLDDIQAERGTGYLLVSHDPDVIEHMSDRVVRIEDGRLLTEPEGVA